LAEDRERARYAPPFFLAMLVSFLFFASMHLLAWTLPLYLSSEFHSATAVGLIIGVMAVSAVLLRPLAGQWADRHGRKLVILLGAGCFTVAPLLYMVGGSVTALVLGRLIHGVGICLFTTGYGSLIPDLAASGRRGEAIGLASISVPISLMIAPRLGSLVQERYGFPFLFAVAGLVAVVAFGVGLMLPKGNCSQSTGASAIPFRKILNVPRLWAALVAVVALAIAYGAISSFLPLFAEDRGISQGSYFFLAYGLALVLVSAFMGSLSDRWGRAKVIVPGMLGVVGILAALSQVEHLTQYLLLAFAFGFFASAAKVSLDAFCVDSVPLEGRGAAVSLEFGVYDMGIGLGAWGLGAVADAAGYGGMFLVMAGLMLVGLAAFTLFLRRNGRAA
jgi:predicted MFS family arabinose efflux permease